MRMATITVHRAKSTLSQLIERALKGEEISQVLFDELLIDDQRYFGKCLHFNRRSTPVGLFIQSLLGMP